MHAYVGCPVPGGARDPMGSAPRRVLGSSCRRWSNGAAFFRTRHFRPASFATSGNHHLSWPENLRPPTAAAAPQAPSATAAARAAQARPAARTTRSAAKPGARTARNTATSSSRPPANRPRGAPAPVARPPGAAAPRVGAPAGRTTRRIPCTCAPPEPMAPASRSRNACGCAAASGRRKRVTRAVARAADTAGISTRATTAPRRADEIPPTRRPTNAIPPSARAPAPRTNRFLARASRHAAAAPLASAPTGRSPGPPLFRFAGERPFSAASTPPSPRPSTARNTKNPPPAGQRRNTISSEIDAITPRHQRTRTSNNHERPVRPCGALNSALSLP